LREERYSRETELVDRLMEAIHKEKAAWGMAEVSELAPTGAFSFVLVTSSYLKRAREEGLYEALAETMRAAERTKSEVHILDTSVADQIDRLGGIAGVRRW
jgi:stalled ribosome rescue protein Dom34